MLPNLTENYLTRGFWGDEAWTSLISQLSFIEMLKTTAADFHPPGYYVVVSAFYQFLPTTEIVTRSVSIIFYLLTAVLAYKLGSEIKSRRFGIVASVLVLVSPIFFTYAFEARNYTMFAFAATGSIYFFLRLSQNFSLKNILFFIFFSTLGIYTHYYMLFTLAAQGFYLIAFYRELLLKMMVLYLLTAVLYVPWIPFLYSQVSSVGQSYWIAPIGISTHVEAVYRILTGENQNIFQPLILIFSGLLLVTGVANFLTKRRLDQDTNQRRAFILMWVWLVVPFILATLPGLSIGNFNLPFRPIFFWRYLIPAAIPLALLFALGIYGLPRRFFKVSLVVFIFLSITISYLTFLRYPDTFRQVYDGEIVSEISSSDKIVTILPSFAEVLYYRNKNNLDNELIILPEGLVKFSGKSLLDAYAKKGVVKIEEAPSGVYFELRPGPSIKIVNDI